jgi:Family of unknown function (DUF6152)
MRLPIAFFCAAAVLAILPSPAPAHHSFAAEYDGAKPIKLVGTITKFDMINPHSWLYVDAPDAEGKTISWSFETAAPNILFRRGFKRDYFKIGTVVTVEGFLAKDGTKTGNAQRVTLPDGKQLILGTEVNPDN